MGTLNCAIGAVAWFKEFEYTSSRVVVFADIPTRLARVRIVVEGEKVGTIIGAVRVFPPAVLTDHVPATVAFVSKYKLAF